MSSADEVIDGDLGKSLVTYRVLVSRREAGAIIGHSGDNITAIRDANGVKAGVSKVVDGTIDRILTVSGKLDNVPDALVEIAQSVAEANYETVQQAHEKGTDPTSLITYDFFPLKPLTQRPKPDDSEYEETLFLRLLIPNSQIGTLIGRGGSRIKSIQEENDVKMVASKGFLDRSTERLVEVQGTEENLRKALDAVSNCLLREYQGTATTTFYTPCAPLPRRRQQQHQQHQQQHSPRQQQLMQHQHQQQQHQQAAQLHGDDEELKKMQFPEEYIGALIGKRGSRIQEVRRVSRCSITVDSESDENGEREVTIVGPPEDVEVAVEMLQDVYEREKGRLHVDLGSSEGAENKAGGDSAAAQVSEEAEVATETAPAAEVEPEVNAATGVITDNPAESVDASTDAPESY